MERSANSRFRKVLLSIWDHNVQAYNINVTAFSLCKKRSSSLSEKYVFENKVTKLVPNMYEIIYQFKILKNEHRDLLNLQNNTGTDNLSFASLLSIIRKNFQNHVSDTYS